MFFYNVNMLPSELFDESISLRVGRRLFFFLMIKVSSMILFQNDGKIVIFFLQVYDSFSLRSDSLMGEFKVG